MFQIQRAFNYKQIWDKYFGGFWIWELRSGFSTFLFRLFSVYFIIQKISILMKNTSPQTLIPIEQKLLQQSHHDLKYKKKQVFTFISNKNLSNLILMPFCGIFWTCGFLYSNQHKISPIQNNLARYICQIVSIMFVMIYNRQSFNIKTKQDFKTLIIRSTISGINGMAASFFQMYLPLTVYYTINSSSTIFTFVLNYVLYGIPITPHQKKAVVISMVGIILVINGRSIYQFLDSSYQFQSSFDYSSKSLFTLTIAAFLVVVWSCAWSYGIIISGKHHASFHQFIFINTLVGFFMFAVMELGIPVEGQDPSYSILFTRKPQFWLGTLLYTGCPIAFANYIFNGGLFISPNTGISTMIIQVNIFYVYIISTIRYGQSINLICLLGAVLLVGSIYVAIFRK